MKSYLLIFLTFMIINNSSIFVNSKNLIINQKTIYVDDDAGANYTSIQDAIDNATDGDLIYVYNGLYYEHLTINKSIILQGEDKNNTIIDGNHLGIVINITANFVSVKGFTIKNCGENLSYTNNNIDTTIEIGSKNNTILDNRITWDYFPGLFYNPYGIKVILYSDNNDILNNEILQCINGIWLESSYNKICNNLFEMNGGDGIDLLTSEPDKPFCSNNNISNNTFYSISSKGYGLAIWGTHVKDNFIYSNTISDSYIGIHVEMSDNNMVLKNNIKNCFYWGISVCNSDKNKVLNNTISYSKKAGIYLGYESNKNLIQNNNLTNNRIGIYLTNNKRNKFYQNNFIDNRRHVKFAMKSLFNHWKGNYWDNQIIHGLPKILFGRLGRFIPWFDIDWHPSKKSYKI
jgi:nitrous oxidase accessory protein